MTFYRQTTGKTFNLKFHEKIIHQRNIIIFIPFEFHKNNGTVVKYGYLYSKEFKRRMEKKILKFFAK